MTERVRVLVGVTVGDGEGHLSEPATLPMGQSPEQAGVVKPAVLPYVPAGHGVHTDEPSVL